MPIFDVYARFTTVGHALIEAEDECEVFDVSLNKTKSASSLEDETP